MQDYGALLRTHRENDADITIATHAVGKKQAYLRGITKVDRDTGMSWSSALAYPDAHYCMSGRGAEFLLHVRASCLSHLRQITDLRLLKGVLFLRAGLVTDFEEKPSAERLQQLQGVSRNATAEDPYEASMGIYMFKREVLSRLLDRHRAGNNTKPDAHFGYDVIPHALEDGLRIFAHHHPGYWRVSALLRMLWT